MIRAVLLAFLLACAAGAGADPLDEAVALVSAAHPVLASKAVELAEAEQQTAWSSNVTFSYSANDVFDATGGLGSGAGPNAWFTLRIPLFDRSYALRLAKARTEAGLTRDTVLSAFLADIERLRALAAKAREADELRGLYRDRLEYWREAMKQGRAEPDRLWPEAEQLKKAEHGYRQAASACETAREATARRYGGERWKKLKALLAEITN